MNNIKVYYILLSMIFIASCNEKIETYTAERITVVSEIGQTKAGYEGTSILPSEFIMDISQNAGNEFDYSLVTMSKTDGNLYKEQDDITLYWADNDRSKVNIKALTLPYGSDKNAFGKSMMIKVCEDQTSEDNVIKSDLLGAETGNGITVEGNNIKIIFKHLMSKLYVEYSFKEDIKAEIKSITLEHTCIGGGYSYLDMDYDNSVSTSFGNILMYHDTKEETAEAIFYPHIQTEDATLVIKAAINGIDKEYKCPVAYKKQDGFIGGKKYKMNLILNASTIENSSVTEVREWIEDTESIETLSDKKILWIGTSIPKGEGYNNYPRMVGEILGCEVINNARGASFATFDPAVPQWTTFEEFANDYVKGFSLSATENEVETKFNTVFRNIMSEDNYDHWMNEFKQYSYENLIIPFIQGEYACDIIIIDHGFNDHINIVKEGQKYPNADGTLPSGLAWYESLASGKETYEDEFDLGKQSFIHAMSYIIEECRKVNPDLKIIIGNYFSTRSPVIHYEHKGEGDGKCTELILRANEAVAAMYDLDIVNVYEYTGLDNEWYVGFEDFCKDNIHPANGGNVKSNEIIAEAYVKELKRIFSGR